jgi:hypothetical protein
MGALADQQLARAVQRQKRLLLDGFHRHEVHGRALHGLTDRIRIPPVVLVGLQVRLYVAGWDQFALMAELFELARPVVGGGAGLHAYHAGWEVGEEPS